MLALTEEQKQDEALARQINQDALTNTQSPYAGKHVGILGGQVVAVVDTLDEVVDALAKIEPDPNRGMVVEASANYDETVYIWRIDLCSSTLRGYSSHSL
jgi:hypothetical protein